MSAIFQRLVLALPERHLPGKNSFATEPKALRVWIEHLPLANPTTTAKLLIGALREMNQLRLDPTQRAAALEMLRGPCAQIVGSLDRLIQGDTFPLPPQKQQLGQLAKDFERELSIGYSSLVYDLCAPAGAVPFMRSKTVAMALTRAIQHYGTHLYKAYLLYHAPPTGVWQTLHDLFRFAVAVRLDEKAVEDPLSGGQTSPREAYMHALLYALSNPYRFTQKENAEIFGLTRLWARYCELRQGRAPEGAIAVRVDSDDSLGYLPEERESPSENLWAFEITGLTRFIDGELAMLPPGANAIHFRLKGGATARGETGLIERMSQAWSGSAERGHPRLPAGHRMDSLIGLHAAHYVLCGNMDFDAFMRSIRGVAISLRETDRVASWTAAAADQSRVIRHTVKVLDQSLGGYRLQWEKVDGMRAKVGEMLALAPVGEDDDEQDWMLGTIRWMRFQGNSQMEAGIELLSRRATPVGLRSFDLNGIPRAPMRGVELEPLLHDDDVEKPRPILAPHLFDRTATEVEVTRAGDPFALNCEPTVEVLREVTVVDYGGVYLQILASATSEAETISDEQKLAAANDDLELAASSEYPA